ncbi:YtxH domain-containing protein [Enterococcus timonensis]|uniref:YtxH domain-containing protein n=1 Tax=Enterococcus timonensis TaxID=1852364 RepID=UPI0008DA9A09|nr:YtxH domain-containing protein [Enterococcus timonensis]
MSLKKFIHGLFFGSLAGGLFGLFVAPASGKETREAIQTDWTDLKIAKENLQTSFQAVKKNAQKLKDTMPILNVLTSDLQKSFADYQFQMEPRLAQVTETLKKIQDEMIPAQKPRYVRYYLPKRK